MIFGWDEASWQGIPNILRMIQVYRYLFCFEKITGEGNYVNLIWVAIRALCRQCGVLFGGYDWVEPHLMASDEDGVFYARDYLRVYTDRQPGEIVGVDFESPLWASGPLGRNIESAMRAYFFTLRDEGGGKVLVYTARYFLQETGASAWAWLCEANGFYLWQAAPGATGTLPDDADWPGTPAPFAATAVHQFDWYGTNDAVAGNFDRNRFLGTIEELRALGLPGGAPAGPPTQEGEVQIPPAGKWGFQITEAGETVVALNFGGKTTRVSSVRIADIGVGVESATEPGVIDYRSFKDEQALDWHEARPAPDATRQPVGTPKVVQ